MREFECSVDGITVEEAKYLIRRNRPVFVYSDFWHTWSRLLHISSDNRTHIEVNLTPVPNSHGSSTWENDVRPIVIRAHKVAGENSNRLFSTLPDFIISQMKDALGKELSDRLLRENFLATVSVQEVLSARYDHQNNGCVRLADLVKEEQLALQS